jgi:hypothetical protein
MSGECASGSCETEELRMVAIVLWRYQHIEGERKKKPETVMLEVKAEEERRIERFRAELRRIVGERDDIGFKVNGGCVEAEVEDLRFVALEYTVPKTRKRMALVTLLGRCPSCGVEAISEPIYNLAGLGERLERFEPISEHCCHSQQRSKLDE